MMFNPNRYASMPYRRCGRSGLKLPAISLGFWQSLGEQGRDALCREVMFHAFDAGITHFDFANNYGPPPGNAEEVAGRILKEMPRDELVISTKAGHTMWPGPYGDWGSRKYLIASLDQSLRRLQLDYVDIFYHHRFDPETPMEESLGALDQIVRSGKALYAGLSSYNGEQFLQATQIIRRNGWTRILIHQPRYNMIHRAPETDLFPHTHTEGVGVIAFCPLAQGALTNRYLGGIPGDSRRGRQGESGNAWYNDLARQGVWKRVERLNTLAEQRGQTMAQLALAWTLRDPRVTSALIGVSRLEQLKDNLATLSNLALSQAELDHIEAILNAP